MSLEYSVLMSLYKKENPEYLKLALDSMITQTVQPTEIVLVEDGPLTNELYNVVNSYKEKYPDLLNVVVNEKNLGLGMALNVGLNVCKCNIVARMDTDDISKPDRCEKQLARFENDSDLVILGSHIDEFEGTPDNVVSSRIVPVLSNDIYSYAKKRSAFNHPTVMYKKNKVLEFNGYADLKRNQDVDLFGRMVFGGCKAENVDESLLWFRTNNDLAKRRKSWENTRSYISTIYRFWKMGYSSFSDFAIIAVAQTGMYLMPIWAQNLVYKKLLRK